MSPATGIENMIRRLRAESQTRIKYQMKINLIELLIMGSMMVATCELSLDDNKSVSETSLSDSTYPLASLRFSGCSLITDDLFRRWTGK